MAELNNDAISDKGRNVRSFSMTFKFEAIQYAERVSNRASSTKYKVDVMRIREWRKDKDAIEELKAKPKGKHRERLDGGGRKGFVERLDDLLLEWI